MPAYGSEEYSPTSWTLKRDRERSYNDLYRQQSEEQRAQLARQGEIQAQGTKEKYGHIADGITGAFRAYREGKADKRTQAAHDQEMKLSGAQLGLSEEQTKGARIGNERSTMELGGAKADQDWDSKTRPDGMTNRQYNRQLDTSKSEEDLASSRASTSFTKANTANLSRTQQTIDKEKSDKLLDEALISLESTNRQIQSLDKNAKDYPARQAELQGRANQLSAYVQTLAPADGRMLVRQGSAASAVTQGIKQNQTADDVTATARAGYQPLEAALSDTAAKAEDIATLAENVREYEATSNFGGDEEAAFEKVFVKLPDADKARIEARFSRDGFGAKTRSSVMKEIAAQQLNELDSKIRRLEISAQEHPKLAARIPALKALRDDAKKILASGGRGAQNQPFPNRPQPIQQAGGLPPPAPSLRGP